MTPIGLISKHAVLIVEFANELQRNDVPKRQVVEQAAGVRLRRIDGGDGIGRVPLIASGAVLVQTGLELIASGFIGTLFTRFWCNRNDHRPAAAFEALTSAPQMP